jgi:uncharacterized coiled-coil DUF342 family protein
MAEDVANLTLELLRQFRGEMMGFHQKMDGFRQEMAEFREEVNRRFEQVDKRFEQVDKRFEQIDERHKRLDETLTFGFYHVQIRLDGHNNYAIDKLRQLDNRVSSIEERIRVRRKH